MASSEQEFRQHFTVVPVSGCTVTSFMPMSRESESGLTLRHRLETIFLCKVFPPAPNCKSANRRLFQRGDGPELQVIMKTVQRRTVATTNFILRAQAANLTRRG